MSSSYINQSKQLFNMKLIFKRTYWNEEKVIERLQEVSNELGHSPSQRELKRKYGFSLLRACDRHLGGLNNTKKLAGLKITLKNNTFFLPTKELTNDFCYCYGFWLGDGSTMGRNSLCFNFGKDIDVAIFLKEKIEKWVGKILSINNYRGNNYTVRINSREMIKFLKSLDKDLLWVNDISDNRKIQILKGLFDAEGWVSKGGYCIEFSNTNIEIIKLFKKICKYFGIGFNELIKKAKPPRKKAYRIFIKRQHMIKFHNLMNGFTIERKEERYQNLIKKINPNSHWIFSEEEIEFIKSNYKNMTDKEIGKKLNKSKDAILKFRLYRLGLKKYNCSVLNV